ncbi:DUF262 domain-containing protein, partial [uncultured Akkermansia sp.]|uniref:DUF262 domain-containing protein n=1 Tax=uncultured Akkermansia sp. TaxID=512294 RepID=UPI00265CE1A4
MNDSSNNSLIPKKIKEIYEMRISNGNNKISLIIPHFQRGFVWNPKQITDLWDSLSKGYPVGAFMCLPASNHTDQSQGNQGYYLMDGQQRCNALCIGVNTGKGNDEELPATLWVDWDELENPRFMVCTPRHPWGFHWGENELTRFSANQMHQANLLFKNEPYGEKTFEQRYEIAPLYEGWPLDSFFQHPIPVPYLLQHDDILQHDDTIGKYKDLLDDPSSAYSPAHLLAYLKIKNNDPNIRDTLIKRFSSALKSKWKERILNLKIPLIIIQSDQLSDTVGKSNVNQVEELFSRINNGGTRLSALDAIYSHITAYWGDIKKINEDIADQFMPANRLISIAGRLAKAKVHRSNKTPEYTFPLHHQELIQWKREKNSLEYQEFKKLYKLSGEDFHT